MSVKPTEPNRSTIVAVEPTRPRQTERPTKPFCAVLATGVNVLMSGAEAATSVVGGPIFAAAVREARTDAVNGIAGPSSGVVGETTTVGGAGAGSSDMSNVAALQRESQAFNLQLLALQEEIQQENRRFSTVTNVLRARHDTAKAAISNIRS